jgi:Glycosyltransferase sugar-binding region containing DXD motif
MRDLPIIQYWHSEQIPDSVAEHIETFRSLNPDLPHMVFSEDSAATLIEERLGLQHLHAFSSCATPIMQANYFRCCAILAMGGVYSDADQRCVRPLRQFLPPAGCGRLYRAPHGVIQNGAFAFGSPGHAFLELVVEIATANIEKRLEGRSQFVTGYAIFTVLVRLAEFGSFDALLARVKGRNVERFARAYCETIADFNRVTQSLEGIEVLASREAENLIAGPIRQLPFKTTNVRESSYRDPISR